jgi:hypothetical protein
MSLIKVKKDGPTSEVCEVVGGIAGGIFGTIFGSLAAAVDLVATGGDLKAAGKTWREAIDECADTAAEATKKHGPGVVEFVGNAAAAAVVAIAVKDGVDKMRK